MVLVGTGCDLESNRVVTKDMGKHIAKTFGIQYREYSTDSENSNIGDVRENIKYLKSIYMYFI